MNSFLIGIDEAGRGPIAGPVSVGLFRIEKKLYAILKRKKTFLGLRDSKKLSEKRREEWLWRMYEWKKIHKDKITFSFELSETSIIDSRGINYAINSGMKKGLKKVKAQAGDAILLDGSLKAPQEFSNQKTIIKGDEKEVVIALASIAAKVGRDTYMKKISKKYKGYDFEIHKGYGTAGHYRKLRKLGLSPEHRKTFLKGHNF